jgi:hypothetical protein
MNQKLKDIISRKQKSREKAYIDWDERRNEYLLAVNNLYEQIEEIFDLQIRDKTIALHRRQRNLSESYIGTYLVEDLILLIGDERVRFSPRGRNIVGSIGRIDVLGDRNEAILILKSDLRWAVLQPVCCPHLRQKRSIISASLDTMLPEILEFVMK